ncbi:MAG: ABC transporter permease, partial [Elusimicrobia bacterium]|nr:ABC transporter permease [Elusimicrobiota bacterium]
SIARKEARHIRRDRVTLAAALGMPILLVCFFGFVIDLNVRQVGLLVADGDRTRASRQLTELFSASGYFTVTRAPSAGEATRALGDERAKAALVINPGFERDVRAGRPASAQLLLDGADNSYAGTVLAYLSGIQDSARRRLTAAPAPRASLRARFLFNPELNSKWFIVPGIFVIVIGLIASLLTALTVAREWENGSMELLLATPVRPLEIIFGKIAPYLVLCLVSVAMIYGMARVVFGVPFMGNHLLFLLATGLFLAATMAQGLVISVVTRQQQLAFQLAMNTGMLPIQLLSGFIFPVESMSPAFQCVTAVIPARWYMTITRALFLRAPDFKMVAPPLAALAALAAVFVAFAWRKFKTDLEP